MTKIEQIEHFQNCVHTFCLLMPTDDFSLNVPFKSPKNMCSYHTKTHWCVHENKIPAK